jgi:hypothetical protein
MSFATVLDAMILFEIKVQRKMGFCYLRIDCKKSGFGEPFSDEM